MTKLISSSAKSSASHRVLALSLLAMGLSGTSEAQAACSPTAPVSNATITCTGDTTNQNGTIGYGTAADNNNTLTVQSGATVTGTVDGIRQGTGFTLNNSGTITGQVQDAVRASSLTFTNSGVFNGFNMGVRADVGTLAGSNSGTIYGVNYGAFSVQAMTLTNSGTIEGVGLAGIRSQTTLDLTNSGTVKSTNYDGVVSVGAMTVRNSGTISAARYGLSSIGVATAENSGSITSGNDAVRGGAVLLTNSGQISSTAGSGVNAFDGAAEITNSGTINGYNYGIYGLGATYVNNSGTINGQQMAGIGSDSLVDLTNSGTVTSTADGINSVGVATVRNSGTIFGTINGLRVGGALSLTNSGTVEGRAGSVLYAAGALTLENSGVLKGTDGEGVVADGAINATNSGTISAYNNAIYAGNSLNLTNSGTIQGTNPTANAAVYSVGATTINNSGTIQGYDGIGSLTNIDLNNSGKITSINYGVVAGGTLNLTNSGTMIGTNPNNGTVVRADGAATVNNSGTIQGFNGVVSGGALTLVNSGKIVALDTLVSANLGGTITNSGTLSGNESGIISDGALTLNNSGTISTGGGYAVTGQNAGGRLTVTNSGTISDTVNAIVGTNAQNHTITNTGLISGGTRAIWLGAGNDTLTLGRTSRTSGRMDLGAGTNTVNIETGGRSAIYTFEGTGITYNNTGTGKLIQLSPNQVASVGNDSGGVDNQSSRLAGETAGMVSGVVQGRLSGNAPGVVIQTQGGSPVLGFAEQAAPRDFGPFTFDGEGRWDGQAVAKSPTAARAPVDPMSIWASAFGGVRSQSSSGTTVGSDLFTYGGVVGVDRRFGNVLLGAFVGGGSSQFKDSNNQTVNTGLVVGGIYGRYEQGRYFVDATLQGGHMSNRSKRETVNNLVPGGLEAARATYSGYYISPELAVGQKIQFANGINVTPIARIRYTGGSLAGYTETGSILAATVGQRAFHSLEERGEVEVSRMTALGTSATVNLTGRLGLIAQHRLGGQSVNATVLGTGVSFTASGRATTIGALAGLGVDLRYGRGVNIFGTLEGTAMNDKSVTGVARGGVRVAF